MKEIIEILKKENELEIIDTPLDIKLEIPALAYLEVKKPNGGKALLFTNPRDNEKSFTTPVLMNVFSSFKRLELITTRNIESIANEVKDLLNLAPPSGFKGFLNAFKKYSKLYYTLPKFTKTKRTKIYTKENLNLYDLPILTTWENDAAPFITMGQVYTKSLDGKKKNLGLYRLQVHSKNELGLHWQIHKDSTHFFNEYKKANKKMPIAIGIGGDPLYVWCAQAPLPHGIYELMLYGLIKRKRIELSKCLSVDLSVPSDCDIVIEGFVDPNNFKDEGPFGDHTGFYTPIEPYPVLEVSQISTKENPIYHATIVGKPPLEDKYMGYLTERVFLPLMQTTAHGLIDYSMPESGVFHNLILGKIAPRYDGHAKQIMHSFWGVGQMSFVKHAIFLGEDAPHLENHKEVFNYVMKRFSAKNIIISEGVADALDHSSDNYAYGGKLGLDSSGEKLESKFSLLSDEELFTKIKDILNSAIKVKQYIVDSSTPSCAICAVEKNENLIKLCEKNKEKFINISENLRLLILVDHAKNDLTNPYMLTWRIANNIDAKRDVLILDEVVIIDASDKNELDSYKRVWPKETDISPKTLKALESKGFKIDSSLLKKFHIDKSYNEDN